LEKAPFLALSLTAGIITIIAQKLAGALQTGARFSMLYRIENSVHSCAEYLFQTFWPAHLAVFYSYPKSFSIPLTIALALAGILLTTAALRVICSSRREEALLERPVISNQCSVSSSQPSLITDHCSLLTGPLAVGWLWYIITLLPVIGLVQVGAQAHADRYTYIPLIGIFIAVVWGVSGFNAKAQRLKDAKPDESTSQLTTLGASASLRLCVKFLSAMGVLFSWVLLTHHQIRFWHDSVALYKHAIAVTPVNSLAHQNLGTALNEQALSVYLRLTKTSDPAQQAGLREQISRLEDDAIVQFQAAVDDDPDYALAHGNLGVALLHKGRIAESIYHSQQAVRLMPKFAGAHRNLGVALGTAGHVDEAIYHLQTAVALAPTDLSSRENLAYALLTKGRTNDANLQLAEANRIRTATKNH
jgi:tetratricopeptide (TPR) repeat protein